jgi:hypothetical protein
VQLRPRYLPHHADRQPGLRKAALTTGPAPQAGTLAVGVLPHYKGIRAARRGMPWRLSLLFDEPERGSAPEREISRNGQLRP